MTKEECYQYRELTPKELGNVIKMTRESRGLTQETLAELTGVSTRTIQRIEQGKASSTDSRRAIARAFDIEDIDLFNKKFKLPDVEKIKQSTITVSAYPLKTGHLLGQLAEESEMDISDNSALQDNESLMLFAELIDDFREYRDLRRDLTEVQKLKEQARFQSKINALGSKDIALMYAKRKVPVRWGDSKTTLKHTVVYICAFEQDSIPDSFRFPIDEEFRL